MDTTAQPAIDQTATTAHASTDATATLPTAPGNTSTKAAASTAAVEATQAASAASNPNATTDREIAELELALAEPPAQASGSTTRTASTVNRPPLVTGSAARVAGSTMTSRTVTTPVEAEPTVSEAEAGWLFSRGIDLTVELVGYLVIIGTTILAFITMYWHIGDFDAGAPAFIAIADKALMLIGTLVGSCIGGLVAFLLRRGLKQQRRRAIAQYEAAARLAARRQEAQRIRAQRLAVEQTPVNH